MIKTILIVLLLTTTAWGEECYVLQCFASQYKICGEEFYVRNYSCENDCLDNEMKKWREKNSTKKWGIFDFDKATNDWEGFQKQKKDCLCEKKWRLLQGEERDNAIYYLKKCSHIAEEKIE